MLDSTALLSNQQHAQFEQLLDCTIDCPVYQTVEDLHNAVRKVVQEFRGSLLAFEVWNDKLIVRATLEHEATYRRLVPAPPTLLA